MKEKTCPLCNSNSNIHLESLPVAHLDKLYQKSYQIAISYLYATPIIDLLSCNNCGLRYYWPIVGGDEAFYNALQTKPWYYADDKAEYHFAKKWIKSNDLVLEIGSGKGAFAKMLNNQNYIGLEFSKQAKELAAKQGITIINESVQKHAQQNGNKYDLVCNFQVLEHVLDIHDFLAASVACLKSGGKMILSVPSEDSFLKDIVNDTLNLPPHHISRWLDVTFHKIAEMFGLNVLELKHQPLEKNHYFLYGYSLVHKALRKSIGKNHAFIDLGITNKMVQVGSHLIGKLLQNSLDQTNTPSGHTVTVVFEKK